MLSLLPDALVRLAPGTTIFITANQSPRLVRAAEVKGRPAWLVRPLRCWTRRWHCWSQPEPCPPVAPGGGHTAPVWHTSCRSTIITSRRVNAPPRGVETSHSGNQLLLPPQHCLPFQFWHPEHTTTDAKIPHGGLTQVRALRRSTPGIHDAPTAPYTLCKYVSQPQPDRSRGSREKVGGDHSHRQSLSTGVAHIVLGGAWRDGARGAVRPGGPCCCCRRQRRCEKGKACAPRRHLPRLGPATAT